jgi:hypothetical protein
MAKEKCGICGDKFRFLSEHYKYGDMVICHACHLKERKKQSRQEGQQQVLRSQAILEEQALRNQAISKVCLTTGDIKTPYRILDTIITVKAHQAGYFDSA